MPSTKRCFSLLLALALLLGLAACGGAPRKTEKTLFAMDTVMQLAAYGENAETGLSAAAGTIKELDALLDPEREGGAVWRLNRGETVSDEAVLSLAETCRAVYEASGGALDPTVYRGEPGSEEYSILSFFGGIRSLKYRYDDAQWAMRD